MAWTLNDSSLSLRSGSDVQLSIRSQGVDELTFAKSGQCDVPTIAANTWCRLTDPEGDTVFQGEVKLTQGEADGGSEKNLLRILGPWDDLERLTYRTDNEVRLNFPADPEETSAVALEDAVTTVLTRAIALGARFTIGTINLDGEIPSCQWDNTTCAAILVALLRWSPGAVTWFDYNTEGEALPVLHIVAAAHLSALALPIEGCLGLSVQPRTDFRLPGVRLLFRKKIQTTYGEAEGLATDSAGSPTALGGLVMALDLNPARATFSLQQNRLSVALADIASGDWWRTLGVTSTGDPTSNSSTGDTGLTYYVTAGSLQNWMLATINGAANAEPHGCTGPLASSPAAAPSSGQAFAGTAPALHIANDQEYILGKRKLTATFADGKRWAVELPVTDLATSGTYYRETLTAWDPGESAPAGLAAAIYDAAARLPYSGSFSAVQAECTALAHRPGLALNITGSAWSAISAPIHAATHHIAEGKTDLEFGPSGYLGAADLLELYRATRAKKALQATLVPEEDPAPVNYSATAQSASEPQNEEEKKGSIVVNVSAVTDESGDETSALEQTLITVADQTKRASGGTVTFSDLPVGSYAVSVACSGGFRLSALTDPGSLSGVEVTDEGSTSVNVVVTHTSRLVLFSDDGAGTAISIVVDVADINASVSGMDRPHLKLREVERCGGERALILMSEWYTP